MLKVERKVNGDGYCVSLFAAEGGKMNDEISCVVGSTAWDWAENDNDTNYDVMVMGRMFIFPCRTLREAATKEDAEKIFRAWVEEIRAHIATMRAGEWEIEI